MKRAILVITSLALLVGMVQAQTGYGTSKITLTPSAGAIDTTGMLTNGTSKTISYTVDLATGGRWGTTLEVQNSAELARSGITVSISNPSGEPPFGGNATISVSPSTQPGTYNVTFIATGDDPSQPAIFALIVVHEGTTVTTTINTTNSTTATVQPTTITPVPPATTSQPYITTNPSAGQGSGQAQTALFVSIAAVVVLFVVIAVALKFA